MPKPKPITDEEVRFALFSRGGAVVSIAILCWGEPF